VPRCFLIFYPNGNLVPGLNSIPYYTLYKNQSFSTQETIGVIAMSENAWEVLDTVVGDLQAEIIRGLLEANDIPVVLTQEGIGKSVYPVVIGPLANIQVLVPQKDIELARQLLLEYNSGAYDTASSES
jgi:hypothetical protein